MTIQSLLEHRMKDRFFQQFSKAQIQQYLSFLMRLREAINGIAAKDPVEKILRISDSVRIFYQYWLPQDNVEKIILMCHGFQCHSDLYYVLADYFFDKNILICAMDQRGHGRTSGIRGHLDSFDLVYQDMRLLIHLMKRKFPNVPLYLMGESMGGLTILNFAAQFPQEVEGILALVPGIRQRLFSSLRYLLFIASFLKYVPLKIFIKLPSDYNNPTYFSAFNDYDSHDILHANPVSLGMLFNLLNLFHTTLPNIKNKILKPILICQGTGDKLLDPYGAYELYQHISFPDKTLQFYRNANHSLLMDQNAQKIYSDIYLWLKAH